MIGKYKSEFTYEGQFETMDEAVEFLKKSIAELPITATFSVCTMYYSESNDYYKAFMRGINEEIVDLADE